MVKSLDKSSNICLIIFYCKLLPLSAFLYFGNDVTALKFLSIVYNNAFIFFGYYVVRALFKYITYLLKWLTSKRKNNNLINLYPREESLVTLPRITMERVLLLTPMVKFTKVNTKME